MKLNPNIILVDEKDNPIGEGDVLDVHRDNAKRHRAVSIFLFNKKGELLLQQRSEKKIVGARQWANTCCGNVHVGESYEECAYRRLEEELGITEVSLRPVYTFEYHVQCTPEFSEWEIDRVFVGIYSGAVQPNPSEVMAYEWKAFSGLDLDLLSGTEKYTPWFPLLMNYKQEIQNGLIKGGIHANNSIAAN